jgi:hypothetical protein
MMDIRTALKCQYHAGLKMLRQVVERCPDDVWIAGTHPRSYWRIAFHAAFYTHLYLQQGEAAFRPWSKLSMDARILWENPPVVEPFTKAELLEYVDWIVSEVDATVDSLDLDTTDSGFPWYPNMDKLSHQILNIRHLQGHVGQLSELLMAHGVDSDWISRGP